MMKIIQGIIFFFTNTLGLTMAYNVIFGEFDNLHLAFFILIVANIVTQILVIIYKDIKEKHHFRKLLIQNVLLYSLLIVAKQSGIAFEINLVTPTIILLSAYIGKNIIINLSQIDGFPIPKILLDIINAKYSNQMVSKEDIEKLESKNVVEKEEEEKLEIKKDNNKKIKEE